MIFDSNIKSYEQYMLITKNQTKHKKQPKALFIGRFQPPHQGHSWLFEQKLNEDKEKITMGTRGLISIKGKPILATHWDSYPEALGKELAGLRMKKLKEIRKKLFRHFVMCLPLVDKSVLHFLTTLRNVYLGLHRHFELIFQRLY
jgi:hypothetical protein